MIIGWGLILKVVFVCGNILWWWRLWLYWEGHMSFGFEFNYCIGGQLTLKSLKFCKATHSMLYRKIWGILEYRLEFCDGEGGYQSSNPWPFIDAFSQATIEIQEDWFPWLLIFLVRITGKDGYLMDHIAVPTLHDRIAWSCYSCKSLLNYPCLGLYL